MKIMLGNSLVLLMNEALKGGVIGVIAFAFFAIMSRLDFIVHRTLYHHGLNFSYGWAFEYWITYFMVFIAFSVILGATYWLGSNQTIQDLKVSIAIGATINLLMIGGLQDIMFFALWDGGLPSSGVVWWWSLWIYIFGTWNTQMQIAFTTTTLIVVILLWTILLRRRKPALQTITKPLQ